MRDYADVYLEAMKMLKSFYNHELKENHVEAAKAALEVSVLANQLKVIAMEKADVWLLNKDRQNGWQLGWAK